MNTGGPASEKTLLDEFAGQALVGFFGYITEVQTARKDAGLPGIKREQVSRECYEQAESMLAEKARREATDKNSLTVQTRKVDDDRWAKFQDGIIITFEPTMGWCASIREGSLGSGNTIAEAVANLRTMWEERSAAPVVQESSTTHDDGKVAELQAANRELVEALRWVSKTIATTNDSKSKVAMTVILREVDAILAKHKGAA